ncbi:MAG: hypothetical protein V3U92_12555 [Cellulophaga sp.]
MLKNIIFLLVFTFTTTANSQLKPIKIVDKLVKNRLHIYAINQNEVDLDVQITISGTNFRQRAGKPRFVRVPATSKVNLNSLVVARGKKANYTYKLKVNDSLSRRTLKKPFTLIKIHPKKRITIYSPAVCPQCDSLINHLNKSRFLYKAINLAENPDVSKQLKPYVNTGGVPLDSMQTPILSLGGVLFTRIVDYEQLLEEMKK